jgi:hypothetical protein
MRQYLSISLVGLLAIAVAAVGCATVDQSAQKRSLYVDQHPELSVPVADAILNGQIMVGMTQEMVQAAWGKAVRVEPVVREDAVTQWIYGNYFVGGNITRLFFDTESTLVGYEVNNQPASANAGTLSSPMDDESKGLLTGPSNGTLTKASGQP